MQTTTNISQMWKFHFGRKILCANGEAGSLAHVVFENTTRRMTHLGVKPSHLFSKTVDLPYDTVVEATGDGIRLSITYEELMAVSKIGVQGAVLDHRSLVERVGSQDKGILLLIAVHPEDGALAYFVVRRLHPEHAILLREQYVKAIASRQVDVALSDATLSVLPSYRPDDELQQEIERVLFDLTPLHLDMRGFTVRVLDSVVYLNGNISSQLRADIVENQVWSVPGLLEIKNNLLGDDRLAADLAMALAQDPRTHDLPIGIYPRLGEVRLRGAVHSNQQMPAVEEVVARCSGVRAVINDLAVNAHAELLSVLLPTGIEAEDKVPGKYVRHTK